MDTILDGLGVPDTRREFFYFADPILRPVPPAAGRRGLRVVNAARLNWVRPMPPGFCTQDHKGTDVLLHGAAAHVAAGRRLTLVLFRKGLHVAETEALVRELGLAPHVEWQDEVGLHAFHRALAEADVVCDQFGESFPGMSTLDALAMGRPVVASVHPRIQQGLFAEPWPVRHAATPTEVAAHLAALADPEARARAGAASAAFASRHLSPLRAAQVCLGYFDAAHAARVTGAA
jgi:glycosyltransferase involved in cell wall biosynthesis